MASSTPSPAQRSLTYGNPFPTKENLGLVLVFFKLNVVDIKNGSRYPKCFYCHPLCGGIKQSSRKPFTIYSHHTVFLLRLFNFIFLVLNLHNSLEPSWAGTKRFWFSLTSIQHLRTSITMLDINVSIKHPLISNWIRPRGNPRSEFDRTWVINVKLFEGVPMRKPGW